MSCNICWETDVAVETLVPDLLVITPRTRARTQTKHRSVFILLFNIIAMFSYTLLRTVAGRVYKRENKKINK